MFTNLYLVSLWIVSHSNELYDVATLYPKSMDKMDWIIKLRHCFLPWEKHDILWLACVSLLCLGSATGFIAVLLVVLQLLLKFLWHAKITQTSRHATYAACLPQCTPPFLVDVQLWTSEEMTNKHEQTQKEKGLIIVFRPRVVRIVYINMF